MIYVVLDPVAEAVLEKDEGTRELLCLSGTYACELVSNSTPANNPTSAFGNIVIGLLSKEGKNDNRLSREWYSKEKRASRS